MALLPPNALQSLVTYNPALGEFHWIGPPSARRPVGMRLGYKHDAYGHLAIRIGPQTYWLHRVAWVLMTGEHPQRDVDHINGDAGDNRWANLRLATTTENNWNTGRRRNNRSGTKGVWWDESIRLWVSMVVKEGVRHRQRFRDKDAAIEHQRRTRTQLHGDFARLE